MIICEFNVFEFKCRVEQGSKKQYLCLLVVKKGKIPNLLTLHFYEQVCRGIWSFDFGYENGQKRPKSVDIIY